MSTSLDLAERPTTATRFLEGLNLPRWLPLRRSHRTPFAPIAVAVALVAVYGGAVLAAQDRFSLKAPNGVAFAEFRGYADWQDVAVSQTEHGLKVIAGNNKMVDAYRAGIPNNGKPFPDGVKIVKIEWTSRKNPVSPYFVMEPDMLKSISFIEKDSKRFPETSGWGYAQFNYDVATDTFMVFGKDASFGKEVCYSCHTLVKDHDYIFTSYPKR